MKKKYICLCVCLLCACTSSKNERLDSEKAYEMMKEDDVVVLDVRTPDEFKTGHIENASNIPLDDLSNIETEIPDKSTTILVYCRSGNRSAQASERLEEMGYENIYDFGGIQDWPYDVVK